MGNMLRLTTLFALLCLAASLHADDLSGRLRLLYPGEDAVAVAERQYLSKQLDEVFRQLTYSDRITRKSTARRVAAIQARYYVGVLQTYDEAAVLTDAFRDGRYNDATATLLLALTLERFNIPYEGYIDHWESYLRIQPDAKTSIVLRSGAAASHTPAAERSYRRQYLTLLRGVLATELTDLSSSEADALFYRYHYSPHQRMSFRQLAAYAQFRQAQQAYSAGALDRAQALLAAARDQDNRHTFLLWQEAVKLQQLALHFPSPEAYIGELFAKWRVDTANRYLPAALLRQFDRRQQELLAADLPEAALALLKRFSSRGPAPAHTWRAQLKELQQLRLLSYYQSRGEEVQALHLAEAMLAGEPNNGRYQDYVAELTMVNLRHTHDDADELVAQAKQAALRHPFIGTHDRYADVILRRYALRVRDAFAGQDPAAGERTLKEFRDQLAAIPNGYDRKLWTLTAFVAASNYYFAEEDYAPARRYIDEALAYDPTNDFLLHQRDLLARY